MTLLGWPISMWKNSRTLHFYYHIYYTKKPYIHKWQMGVSLLLFRNFQLAPPPWHGLYNHDWMILHLVHTGSIIILSNVPIHLLGITKPWKYRFKMVSHALYTCTMGGAYMQNCFITCLFHFLQQAHCWPSWGHQSTKKATELTLSSQASIGSSP